MLIAKQNPKLFRLIIVLLCIFVLVGHYYVAAFFSGQAIKSMLEVRNKLYVGMSFEEAHKYLKEASAEYACEYENKSINAYVFGKPDSKYSMILVVDFEVFDNGDKVVTDISSLENYMLHEFKACSTT